MRAGFLVIALSLSGCAAGRAGIAIAQAESAIQHAEREGAGERSPYELFLARHYITKAREEAQFSAYRDSVQLAGKAAELADKSVINSARLGGSGPSASASTGSPTAPKAPSSSPPTPEPAAEKPAEKELPEMTDEKPEDPPPAEPSTEEAPANGSWRPPPLPPKEGE